MVDLFKDLLAFLLPLAVLLTAGSLCTFRRSKEGIDGTCTVKLYHFVSQTLQAIDLVDNSLDRLAVLVARLR